MSVENPGVPEQLTHLDVQIPQKTGESTSGRLTFRAWSDRERRSRGLKRTVKLVGGILAICSIALFVHILLVVMVPLAVLTVLAAFPLYLKFQGESQTVYHVEGKCPECGRTGQLRPYIDSQLGAKITVQCPECGQTTGISVPLS